MVKAVRGCLIKTEPSVKEVILKISETEHYVIEDINETTLFVNYDCLDTLKSRKISK
ncbi:putative subunit Tfb5 of transcription factor TFIIH complex [Hamiltosporidium tvaerminnensis]|uniref:General transcription and DNA repair factor IIH subunit TFB5 n=1 Tax=Hamiltosporidium tvaerminnensis TaxID=1176355 RepID=A0A4Q9LXQ8_9MICR|nr:putative subunit Tfb5 of transcription factor TFIIH complex [Hamiltosporidium tvaerminnensis]